VRVSAYPVSARCHDSLSDVNTAEITCPSEDWREYQWKSTATKTMTCSSFTQINNPSQPVHSYCLSSYDSTKHLSLQVYLYSLCWRIIYVLVVYVSCRANPNAQTTNSLEIISPILHPQHGPPPVTHSTPNTFLSLAFFPSSLTHLHPHPHLSQADFVGKVYSRL